MTDTITSKSMADVSHSHSGDPGVKSVLVHNPAQETQSTTTASAAAAGPAQAGTPSGGSNPSVRTRITVVCAECKRLKLKCDRRNPCGSCVKRETISRCIYSAAAAEKIDVQSLHNRLLQVETQLSVLNSTPGFVKGSGAKEERALFDPATSSSSLSIALSDVAEIWLSQLDLNSDSGEPLAGIPNLEPKVLPDEGIGSSIFDLMSTNMGLFKVPPGRRRNTMKGGIPTGVTPDLIKRLPAQPLRDVLLSHLESTLFMHPCINFTWFKSRLDEMFAWADTPDIHNSNDEDAPTLSFFACAAAGFAIGAQCWQEYNELNKSQGAATASAMTGFAIADSTTKTKFTTATATIGASGSRKTPPGSKSNSPKSGSPKQNITPKTSPPPRKSVSPKGAKGEETRPPAVRARSISGQGFNIGSPRPEAHNLYALATVSLNLWTQRFGYAGYDADYVHAHLLRVLYLLYASGRPEVAHELFPLMGHLVNTARMMSLNLDPDDGTEKTGGTTDGTNEPGKNQAEDGDSKYTLFDKETRRRLWWQIYYYDLFVSDTMGQSPLIVDDEMQQTTKLPTDVDEENFGPHSSTLPPPRDDNPRGNLAYFIQQARLAQLVKSIRRRCNPSNGLCPSIDEAVSYETEINQWVAELPERFRLDVNQDLLPKAPPTIQPPNVISSPGERVSNEVFSLAVSPSASQGSDESPYHIAQRCEIAVITNRIMLKVFMPFLKNAVTITGNVIKAPTQAVLSTVNAAHAIVQASSALRKVWAKTRPATHVFYCFARTLFDAALITANNALTQPQTIFSRIALEDVALAVQVLKDPVVAATGRGPVYGPPDGSPGAASKILEVLQHKAVKARSMPAAPNNAGTKRKLAEMDIMAPQTGTAALAASSRPAFQVTNSNDSNTDDQAKAQNTQPSGPSQGPSPTSQHSSEVGSTSKAPSRKSVIRSGISSHASAPPKTKYGNAPWSSAAGGTVPPTPGGHSHGHGHAGSSHRSEEKRKPTYSIRVRDENQRSDFVRQRTNSTVARTPIQIPDWPPTAASQPPVVPSSTSAPAASSQPGQQQQQQQMSINTGSSNNLMYPTGSMPPPRSSPTTMLPTRTSPSGSTPSQDTPPSGGYTVSGYLDETFTGNYDTIFAQPQPTHHHQSQQHEVISQSQQILEQAQPHHQHQQHQHHHHSHQNQAGAGQQRQSQHTMYSPYVPQMGGIPAQAPQQQQQAYYGGQSTIPFPTQMDYSTSMGHSHSGMHPPMTVPSSTIDPSSMLVMPQSSMPTTPQEHRHSFSSEGSNFYAAMEAKPRQSQSQESLVSVQMHPYGHQEHSKSQPHLPENVVPSQQPQASGWPDPSFQQLQQQQQQQPWDGGYSYYK